MVLRVLSGLLELVPMRLLEWVCCGRLVALRMPMVLLRWGAGRRSKRRWKRWLTPPLAQFPLSVERCRV